VCAGELLGWLAAAGLGRVLTVLAGEKRAVLRRSGCDRGRIN